MLAFFSTKRERLPGFKKIELGIPQDFCTCLIQCVPDLVVFTDEEGEDFYKNDFTSLFSKTLTQPPFASGSITQAVIEDVNTGVETPLVGGTHGTQVIGVKFWWFKVDWYKIWQALGYGRYRLKFKTQTIIGTTLVDYCSPIYSLKKYSDKLANGTIRLEFFQLGRLNHSNDFRNLLTATVNGKGVVYEGQVRLPGSLKWASGNEEIDHLTLNGTTRPSYQIKDQVRPKYQLDIHLVSAAQFVSVYFDDMFASPLNVTDYNVYNFVSDPRDYQAKQYRSLPLIKETSNFDPTSRQVRKSFSFEMRYFNDNIFKTTN